MNKAFVNQELEFAAKRTLTHITGSEGTLKSLYLQPDRAVFLAENTGIILKVYMAGKSSSQRRRLQFALALSWQQNRFSPS